MVVDFHDAWPDAPYDYMALLHKLKDENDGFKVTLFAAPGRGTDGYWQSFPDWVELACHGWLHPDPYECADWDYDRMTALIWQRPYGFVRGFCAPGWQISDGCYQACLDAGWWVADHPENDGRRPKGLRTQILGEGDHLHGHLGWNGSGNDLAANFDVFRARVAAAETFEFVSEAVAPWAAGAAGDGSGRAVAA